MTTDYPMEGTNSGHGHVYNRADGMVARCGGPAFCNPCARDKAARDRWEFAQRRIADPESPRYIVCAAMRHVHTKEVRLGIRHWDAFMAPLSLGTPDPRWEQGFVDQYGLFLNRKEAWAVAEKAKQIRRRVGGDEGGVLYSENLY